MRISVRLAAAGYLLVLTLGLLAGSWPLQGPLLFQVIRGHGLHIGDLLVLVLSASLAIALLTERR